jgi:hypothetical protein
MRALSAGDILKVWDLAQDRHPVDRAVTLLWFACPELGPEALVELPVGRRDALVFALRERTFGETLEARVACPACSANVELSLHTSSLRAEPPPASSGAARGLEADGFQLRFRLPDSRDLAEVAALDDPHAALERLLEHCVLSARRLGGLPGEDETIAPADLPVAIVERLAEAMAEQDPQAEVLLNVACPACGHAWQAVLDIVDFVFREVSVEAARLLGEIDALARAYHWREADILAMSSRRRQAYLEMATA